MGGKLIQSAFNLPEKRLNKEEYFPLVEQVIDKLGFNCFLVGFDPRPSLIQAYSAKESFGDCDILCVRHPHFDYSKILKTIFGVQPVSNGGVYTLPIEGFQFDFSTVPEEIYDTALGYFNYSPQGNAIGKLYHSLKLRYGHEGLFYTLREEDVGGPRQENSHVMENVFLTRCTETIHEFIGVNHNVFLDGFDKETDIFEWIASSPYFYPDRFSFEEMNHRARTRDKKRPDYNRLMHWIQENKERLPNYVRKTNKADYLPMICERFPVLAERLKANKENYINNQIIKMKFNGELVKEWTGIEDGKMLGIAISEYKKDVELFSAPFRKFILDNDGWVIKEDFIRWYYGFFLTGKKTEL